MCNDRTLFDEYKENTNPKNTIITASSNTRAKGYSTVTITAIQSNNSTIVLKLENVFHMLSLAVNLLSSPTIMEKGLYINGLTQRFATNMINLRSANSNPFGRPYEFVLSFLARQNNLAMP